LSERKSVSEKKGFHELMGGEEVGIKVNECESDEKGRNKFEEECMEILVGCPQCYCGRNTTNAYISYQSYLLESLSSLDRYRWIP
jgi:hypothetical protein